MNAQHPPILKLDLSGMPIGWIDWQTAAVLYSRNVVKWEAGDNRIEVLGGFRGDGERSSMTLSSIIAVKDKSGNFVSYAARTPYSRRAVLARDKGLCLYCGGKFHLRDLTIDHVLPRAQGGPSTFENSASACKLCNGIKGNRTPEMALMPLLAVPYHPSPAEGLILAAAGRRVLADQMAWLESFAKKGRDQGSLH